MRWRTQLASGSLGSELITFQKDISNATFWFSHLVNQSEIPKKSVAKAPDVGITLN
jgi:hypothetical protein